MGKIYAEGNVLYHIWEKKYTSLVNRFNTVESRLKEVKARIVEKPARHDEVEYFIEDLKKQDLLTVFDENVWLSMVDHLTVHHDGKVELTFLDGSQTELKC
ncbi:hypothetical protein [Varibaculum cambriense]|uniref:hypothetical protein n=1 Tax=Varibaculum cambriense TaxID=184870 RepID=UPI002556460C|nr:hypothetical protein [Varibaculum cambriense]